MPFGKRRQPLRLFGGRLDQGQRLDAAACSKRIWRIARAAASVVEDFDGLAAIAITVGKLRMLEASFGRSVGRHCTRELGWRVSVAARISQAIRTATATIAGTTVAISMTTNPVEEEKTLHVQRRIDAREQSLAARLEVRRLRIS